jgi:hypothetical protein
MPAQPSVETAIKLVDAKSQLSASTSTLIRVKALPKETSGSSAAKGSNYLVLNLEVTPSPALAWQGVVNVDIRRVVDERGIALAQSHTHNTLDGASNTIMVDGMPIQIPSRGERRSSSGNVQVWGDITAQSSKTIRGMCR